MEEDLLLRLGMCIDIEDAKSSGITDKVLRSIDPNYATDRKEKRIRERKREKLIQEIVKFKGRPPVHGFLPNFRLSNVYYPEYFSVLISAEKLEKLCHKIVRGITYITDSSLIENCFEINFFILEDKDAQPVLEHFQKSIEKYELPGIKVLRAMAADDKNSGFYAIEIWGRLKMYSIVRPQQVVG
ncbi:hypothetical protein VB713_27515 [Anabaena cylindrica UHCC 0172]|uniref:hypothetical protein n=1 Tax=Anabaena cylindrica TaxID=1165 RepID=UPI002B2059F1|nr:hypothetical protein [Anabaena cylindrica]MEA5554680.1 hypothetical protein [Anabaena cylindrica UHCC 0172]